MRLVARGLAFRFASGFVAGPLDLDVGPGLHQLAGPNGSGKSTLLRCLCGGLRGSEGAVSVGGLDPRTTVEGRRRIALWSAEPELPGFLTVDEAWRELAALRGASSWDGAPLRARFDLPGGLPLGHCSAGQRRLAELVAALAGDPPVALLDEPFANLDPTASARVVELISELRTSRVLVFTHHGPTPIAADSRRVLPPPAATRTP